MKDDIRQQIIERKRLMTKNQMDLASRSITQRVLALPEWQQARVVSIYSAFPSEVQTDQLRKAAVRDGKIVVTPESESPADCYLVPGVAFDRQGNRLGRGRGFYDWLLAGVSNPKIGLAYEIQMVDNLLPTRYDVPMDMVVTEQKIYGKKQTP